MAEAAPRALLAVVGAACGASAFAFGFFDASVWQPLALASLLVLLVLLVAGFLPPPGRAWVAVLALAGLWLWSLLSTRWAESADQAVTAANRWLLYATVLAVLVSLVRSRRDAGLLIGAATAGLLAVAAYVLVRMIAGDGSALFFNNRLNEPLEYVNGQAAYLLIGFWPLVAVAERARSPLLAGVAIAAAVPLVALTALTQSRGAAFALIGSTVLLLALVPGRLRRGWALVAVGLGVAVAATQLGDVLDTLPPGATAPPGDELREAGLVTVLGAFLAGAGWAAVCWLSQRNRSTQAGGGGRNLSAAGLAAVALVGLAVISFPVGQRLDDLRDQYDAFTELRPAGTSSRLVSGGGNRYDYWRVAVNQFADDPLRGIGAGNYDRTYLIERRTTEDIRQAHSIELQALGETGLVGGLVLAVFLGAVGTGLWRRAHGGPASDPATAVAAGGAFAVWFAHTSVDWLHLIPGLTGIALCAAAVLLVDSDGRSNVPRTSLRPVALTVTAIIVVLAVISVGRPALALKLRSDGWDHLPANPIGALRDADDSLELDDEPLPTYYLKAAAYARLNLYREARATLLEATRREPHDYVTWGLLGDLAVRRGDLPEARRAYARAARLNPFDPELRRLAKDPLPEGTGQLGSETG